MTFQCKWTEVVISALIVLFSLWRTSYSNWIVVVLAALLLIHALGCKCHAMCAIDTKPKKKSKK